MNLFETIFKEDFLDRTAILYEQRRISYAELREQALALERVLRRLGAGSGERVALMLYDSPEFVAAFIAVCSQGAIAVPINLALRSDEQRAILNDCTASRVIVEADLCNALLIETASRLPHLQQIVVVGRDEDGETLNPEEIREQSNTTRIRICSLTQLLRETQNESRQLDHPGFTSPLA